MWAARLTKVSAGETQVAAVDKPYLWQIEIKDSAVAANVVMRPSENPKMMGCTPEKS